MGLLSFLSRKPSSDIQSNHDDVLKAQAYDATVPSMPPIRGTFPVAGNGPNILEKYQRSHPNLRSVASYSYEDESPAPPPLVPRLHSSSTGRPRTASTEHGGSEMGRPRIVPSLGPSQSRSSLRPLPKKRYGSFILPIKTGRNDAADSIYSAPSPAFARNRSSSLRSSNGGESASTKGFVDLLDAQSLIRPSDFHGRVQATGARNYGEDVADRNMMESAPNPIMSKTRELYARTFGMDPASADDESEVDQPRLSRKWRSMGSSLRASSTKSSSRAPLPKKKQSRGSLQSSESKKAEKVNRRKSLPSYMTSSSSDQIEGAPRRGKSKETDADYFPESLRERARAAATREDQRSRSPVKSGTPKTQVNSYKKPRDSAMSARAAPPLPRPNHNRSDSEQTIPDREIRPKSSKYSSRCRSLSHASSLSVPKSNLEENRANTQQTVTRPQTPLKSAQRSTSRRRLGSISATHDSPLQLLQPSQLNSSPRRPSTSNGSSYHARNRSIISLSTKSITALDIESSIPERTSSLRRWSLTSETGGSTRSSNPFRPQSGHTTNTSIDNGPVFPFSPSMTSISIQESRTDCAAQVPSLKAARTHSSIRSSVKSSARQQQQQQQPAQQSEFNIDDYVSSDDSASSPRRIRGEDEKELLFADSGYGADGFQLPGLTGLFDAAVPSRPSAAASVSANTTPAHTTTQTRTPKKPKRNAGTSSTMTSTTPAMTKILQTPFHMTAFTPDDARSIGRSSMRSNRSTAPAPVPVPAQFPTQAEPRTLRLRIPAFSYSDSESDDGDNKNINNHAYKLEQDDDAGSSEDEISFDIPRRRPAARRYSHGSIAASKQPRYETAEEPIFEGQVFDFLDALRSSSYQQQDEDEDEGEEKKEKKGRRPASSGKGKDTNNKNHYHHHHGDTYDNVSVRGRARRTAEI
ncbi:hypothetical protein F4809DRAFT_209890 [Biscogniauxia mediterranea]|nr:hypothetical protein F4809DRAFT_209890 [Biscogniauxia mediterranea]